MDNRSLSRGSSSRLLGVWKKAQARNARCMLVALTARPPQADSNKGSNRDNKDNKDSNGGGTTRGPRPARRSPHLLPHVICCDDPDPNGVRQQTPYCL